MLTKKNFNEAYKMQNKYSYYTNSTKKNVKMSKCVFCQFVCFVSLFVSVCIVFFLGEVDVWSYSDTLTTETGLKV